MHTTKLTLADEMERDLEREQFPELYPPATPTAVTEAEAEALQQHLNAEAARQRQGSSPSIEIPDQLREDPPDIEHVVHYMDLETPPPDPVEEAHESIGIGATATARALGSGDVTLDVSPDPMTLDPRWVHRIVARVGKRTFYDGPVNPAAGQMLAVLQEHGRRLKVTCWMKDGTKRIYRGNGKRIR